MSNPSPPKRTLPHFFFDRAERYRGRQALRVKKRGRYVPISWTDWKTSVVRIALGLFELGVRKRDRVGILSENRPEWLYADMAVLSLGAVNVPIYATSSEADIRFILEHAGIEVLFLSSREQFEKVRPIADQLTSLRVMILFDRISTSHEKAMEISDLVEKGRVVQLNNDRFFWQNLELVSEDDIATLIYTSGTTGPPKGVMLTHGNFLANYEGALDHIQVTEDDLSLSFLPLSHVFERLAGYYFMVFCGATIAFAEGMQTVPQNLLEVAPTVAASVPRLYEKIYAKILDAVESAPPLRRKLFEWATRVGRESSVFKIAGKCMPWGLKWNYLVARTLVFKKLKARLGGRIRFFISGGAPLSKELAEFFYSADVLILEGYGLTETSPVIAVNSKKAFKFGSVGKPLPNIQVRIAQDGEILTKGPCVMKGYYRNEEATREVIRDGWFCTGDIGNLDSEGFLHITDRKKDIIVTSGGKNIAPQNIENTILGDKLFSQVVVIGDKRNYLVALVVPKRDDVQIFAKEHGVESDSWEDLLEKPDIYNWICSRMNEKTKGLASFEQIKYIALLPKELTLAAGELTPTLKVKRKVVAERYRDIIEELYRKGQNWQKGNS